MDGEEKLKIEITPQMLEIRDAAVEAIERLDLPVKSADEAFDMITRTVAAAFRVPVSLFALAPGQLARAITQAAEAEERALVEAKMGVGPSPLAGVIRSREELLSALEEIRRKHELDEED